MTFKISVEAGHAGFGVTAGKRSPDNEYEWDFNNKVLLAFVEEMSKYEDIEILRVDDPTGRTDVPLKTRTDRSNAWGAHMHISFHHNANTGKWGTWGGTETFRGSSAESIRLAQLVQSAMVKAYGLRDRGVKTANLHITREIKAKAVVLLEGAFMDSLTDISKLRDDRVLASAGVEIAKAVAEYGNLKLKTSKPKQSTPPKTAGVQITASKYQVKAGDTLFAISNAAGITVDQLKQFNNLKSDIITVGQVLNLKATSTQTNPTPQQPTTTTPPKTTTTKETSINGQRVVSKINGLRFYSSPSWSDKDVAGHVNKGLGFEIISKLKVGNREQYKVKNSKGAIYYITANGQYVDVTGTASSSTSSSSTKSTTKTASSTNTANIRSIGQIEIINVNNAATIMDKPDRNSAKNVGTILKGRRIHIAGSVVGKNNPQGYWEVIYQGKRCYVSGQFGKRV